MCMKNLIETVGKKWMQNTMEIFERYHPEPYLCFHRDTHNFSRVKNCQGHVAFLDEGTYGAVIAAPYRKLGLKNMRPLSAELAAVWSDLSKAIRGLNAQQLRILVLNKEPVLELPKFSNSKIKKKQDVNDDHQIFILMKRS